MKYTSWLPFFPLCVCLCYSTLFLHFQSIDQFTVVLQIIIFAGFVEVTRLCQGGFVSISFIIWLLKHWEMMCNGKHTVNPYLLWMVVLTH